MCSTANRVLRLERIITGILVGGSALGAVGIYEMVRLKNQHHHYFFTKVIPRITALEQHTGLKPKPQATEIKQTK